MRGLLRIFLAFLAALALTLLAFFFYVNSTKIPRYPLLPVSVTIESTSERVAEGRRIANILCADCHRDKASGKLAGKPMLEVPDNLGRFYSANITRDEVHGIGGWSDGDLARILRTGIRRDGSFAPVMVQVPRMSDEDVASIIAFLKSDDPMLTPVEVDQPAQQPTWLGKAILRFMMKPSPYPSGPVPEPNRGDPVAFGRYLVRDKFLCYGCHTASFSEDPENPERIKGYLSGGFELLDPSGAKVLSANITPDDETGIGKFTAEDLGRALRKGIRPDHTPVRPPMPRFYGITDEEIAAMHAYLKSLPAVKRAIPRPPLPPMPETDDEGAKVYAKYECAQCHGESGTGKYDLTTAAVKYSTDQEIIDYIRHPSRVKPNTEMPDWDGVITDEEFGPLAAYVRKLGEAKHDGENAK
ncbi:MAG: c-type cytochrome [Candidatus Eisenbacteria bacterium]